MSTYQRLIIYLLFTMLLLTACAPRMSPIPTATSTLTRVSTAMSAVTPAGTSTLTPSLSPSVAIPILDSFYPVTRLSLAASEGVLDMVVEPNGNIWLITDLRVLHYSQGAWTNYLSQFSGTLIGMDSNHHVWVVSDDGVHVSAWDGSYWTDMGPETGWEPPMPDNGVELVWSIATDAMGQVWLATDRDVRMFDGIKWKIFDLDDLGMPRPEFEDNFSRTTIAFLKASGYIWAVNCYWSGPGPDGGGGARWYDGHVWHGSDSPVAHGCATVVNEDSLGNIWLGLDDNLWRLNTSRNNWKRFPAPEPPEGNRFGFFTDLALDAVGNPWPELAVCGGASCYVGYVRYHVTGEKWLQIGEVGIFNSSLYFDATGQGWVFALGQVFRIPENQWEPVSEQSILKVAVDPSGKLWIIGIYEDETVLWAQTLDR